MPQPEIPYGVELAFTVLAITLIVSGWLWRTWKGEFKTVLMEWENEQRAKEGRFQERDWHAPSPPRRIFWAKLVFLVIAAALLPVCWWLFR